MIFYLEIAITKRIKKFSYYLLKISYATRNSPAVPRKLKACASDKITFGDVAALILFLLHRYNIFLCYF